MLPPIINGHKGLTICAGCKNESMGMAWARTGVDHLRNPRKAMSFVLVQMLGADSVFSRTLRGNNLPFSNHHDRCSSGKYHNISLDML